MKRGVSILSRMIAVAMLVVAITASAALAAVKNTTVQQFSNGKLTQFDIVLVIDGSGSLVYEDTATDPNGLRYDAINLFLALLTNEGNDVGAIVFDDKSNPFILNTGLGGVSGKDQKIALSDQIRQAGTGNDTDIGSALLEAVTQLSNSTSGKKPVVILMSDGRTDLGSNADALKRSLANKEDAIVMAQDNHIPVFTLCLNASPVADPSELKEIADRTGGVPIEVNKAEDLADAFKQFYTLIFATSNSQIVEDTFPDNGKLEYDFNVPFYGAREVNIIVNSHGVSGEEITSPTKTWSQSEIADSMMVGGIYRIIKLVEPEAGTWHLSLNGHAGDKSMINVIYNVSTDAILETTDGNTEYATGSTATLHAVLAQEGIVIADPNVTREYKAELKLKNESTGDESTVSMTPDNNGGFVADLTPADYATYTVSARVWCESIELMTNELQISFGNTAPVLTAEGAAGPLYKQTVILPFIGKNKSVDVSAFFRDDQDPTLTYSLTSSTLVQDTATLNGSSLDVDTAHSKSGDVIVRATDSQGAYVECPIRFKVTNLTVPLIIIILLGILTAAIVAFVIYQLAKPKFRGNFKVSSLATGAGLPGGDFKGKVKLKKYVVGMTGLPVDEMFLVAGPRSSLELQSKKKPFYINGRLTTSCRLMLGDNEIYANEDMNGGINIEIISVR